MERAASGSNSASPTTAWGWTSVSNGCTSSPSTARFAKGTGLGAAIVYRLVEEHGGKIQLESKPDEGTSVRIDLPRRQRCARGIAPRVATAPGSRRWAALSKILVVEDEKSMRDLLALMLRKEGYEVETAESGDSALELMGPAASRYDLVISDISMPGMSGLELLRQLRSLSGEIEVILMTAFGSKQTAIEALNEGATYYVEKPFDLDEMKAVVRKTLEQKRLITENQNLKLQNRDLRAELCGQYGFDDLIGRSPKMTAIFQLIRRVAGTGSTVMISGESGTGKELIARAIHYNSGRGERPVRIDQLRRACRTSCWRASCSVT